MKYCFSILLVLTIVFGSSQDIKRTQNWYFGDSAGLSFATDPPTVLANGVMNTIEGCATMSDTNGNLLFYTNGVRIWNKNHQIMDNGTGLNGHISSTQSSLIVPWPGNDSLFYIFTTDAVGQFNGLQYSLVNIHENNGLGKVTVKNVLLQTPVCEKLTGTRHANGIDFWIITHKYNSNEFLIFKITKDGLNICPYVQEAGSMNGISGADAQGMLKINSKGNILGNVLFDQSKVELFSFNTETAQIKLTCTLGGLFFPFGIEFSDSSLLYVLDRSKNIYQYNLNLLTETDINLSKVSVASNPALYSTGIQRSSDKIYIAIQDSFFIASIDMPNIIGVQCGFKLKSILLGNDRSYAGLPNFISSYFHQPNLDFTYTTSCQKDSVYFEAKEGTTHTWHIFRNKAILHTSIQPATGYNFTDTGGYIVQLVSGTDTVTKTIYIEPKLELGKDTVLCNQTAYALSIPPNHRCVSWQDGKDSLRYTLTQNGKYYVSAYNIKGCLVSDTVKITFATLVPPVITKSNDSLFTDSGNFTYKWKYNNDLVGGNSHQLKVSKNGLYSVEITDSNGCTNTSANFLVSGLGIGLFNAQEYFSIYPIPASDKLIIESSQNIQIQTIKLRDIAGRSFDFAPAAEVNLIGLASGVYYLELTDTENHHYITKIIIN